MDLAKRQRTTWRDAARRRVGLVTVGLAFAGTAVAGLLGAVLAAGDSTAATEQTTQSGTTTQDDQLQAPTTVPDAGSSGRSHAGTGGS